MPYAKLPTMFPFITFVFTLLSSIDHPKKKKKELALFGETVAVIIPLLSVISPKNADSVTRINDAMLVVRSLMISQIIGHFR